MDQKHIIDADSPSRRSFVRQLGVAAAAVAAGTVGTAQTASGQAGGPGGRALPNLYPNWNARLFRLLQEHENAHVPFLETALGAARRPRPTFKNLLSPNIVAFGTAAQVFENVGVGAYLGATPVIFSRANLAAAGSIALIEARHAGYLNVLFNEAHTNNVFDVEQDFERPLTVQEVVDLATPFVADLNGGPPLSFNATPSRSNDIAILNFALALEYLEQEFYNLNVPRFFPV